MDFENKTVNIGLAANNQISRKFDRFKIIGVLVGYYGRISCAIGVSKSFDSYFW